MSFPEVQERYIPSFDGTELACHAYGDGPPVLLCNGLGGSWRAWSHQMRHFVPGRKFVSWDYRGLYRSRAPRDRNATAIAVFFTGCFTWRWIAAAECANIASERPIADRKEVHEEIRS